MSGNIPEDNRTERQRRIDQDRRDIEGFLASNKAAFGIAGIVILVVGWAIIGTFL